MTDNKNILIGLLVVVVAILLAALALRPVIFSPAYDSGGYQPVRMGPGMMYGPGYNYSLGSEMMGNVRDNMRGDMMALYYPEAKPMTRDAAYRSMQSLARQYGDNVKVEDFMAFSNNYYASLKDASSGQGLAEVLVDRYSGLAYPEPGPNAMWNTRYGAGRGRTGSTGYDLDGAKKLAEGFLEGYLPGAQILESKPISGYYTFDFGRKEIEGMLSVNAYSGQIWVHTWHGFYLDGMNATS